MEHQVRALCRRNKYWWAHASYPSCDVGYVAPEIFKTGPYGSYGNRVDVFSLGATAYVCLCGYEPFYGETDAELKEANKLARIDFPADEWSSISDDAKEFVQSLMEPDPSIRPTIAEALVHPWLVQFGGGRTEDAGVEDTTSA